MAPGQRDAVDIRQADVAQDSIEGLVAQPRLGGGRGIRDLDVKPLKRKRCPQGCSEAWIIVDDEHAHVHLRRMERPPPTGIDRPLGRLRSGRRRGRV
jgi:hypothetical protein